jgi:hypothetical protein
VIYKNNTVGVIDLMLEDARQETFGFDADFMA